VVALDASTGTQRWQAPAGGGSGWPSGRNVIVVGENVIVPDEGLYAYDRATGARQWQFLPNSGDMPGRLHIVSDGVRVYTGSPAGFAYALDPASGTLIWTTDVALDEISAVYSPVVDRGLVVVTLRHFTNPTTGGVVALDAVTGAVRWRREFPTTGPGRGSGSQGRVGLWQNLIIAGSDDGTIYAMDRADGTIAWISPRPDDEMGYDDLRPVMVVGDVVVVGSDRPVLTGLDAASGAERWRIPSAYGSVNFEMGSDGTRVYVQYASLQLSAIDPVAGKIVWTVGSPPGEFLSYPTIEGERVFVGAVDGLFALRR
jgi:outer membrane protein assembly factor BamB